MFDHKQFSIDLKYNKTQYLYKDAVDFQKIDKHLELLKTVDLELLKTDQEKKSFWINVYNGLTNYWIIRKKIKKSMLERPFLVFMAKATIGGFRFSLDDIEHGIIRANTASPIKLWKQFSKYSAAANLAVEQLDPRIHFALNCGAVSCPAIAFYDAEHIDIQLNNAEAHFVEQEFVVDKHQKSIQCSKLFRLYKKDFRDQYLSDKRYKGFKIQYRPYDFSVL